MGGANIVIKTCECLEALDHTMLEDAVYSVNVFSVSQTVISMHSRGDSD